MGAGERKLGGLGCGRWMGDQSERRGAPAARLRETVPGARLMRGQRAGRRDTVALQTDRFFGLAQRGGAGIPVAVSVMQVRH